MSSLNYMELCRLCLINERVSIPIFEEEGDARQLFMKIASCLPVKVAREDRLPKKICNDCLYKLENVYSFWNTTANAEKQLLEWLGEMAVEKRANSEATSIITTKTEQQLVPKEETIESDQPKGSGEDQPGSEEEEEEEEESEEEGSNSDESGGGGDAGPKEEAESEEEPYEELEPTTFVNVSLACDEAGPSGMQQRTAPSTSTAPSGFVNKQQSGNSSNLNNSTKQLDCSPSSTPEAMEEYDKQLANMQRELSKYHHKDQVCDNCNTTFNYKKDLVVHMKIAHGVDRPYACTVCPKRFKHNFVLIKHMLIHKGEKNFKCDMCDYACIQKVTMEFHRRRHFKEFKFQCEVCNKGFYHNNELQEHMNKHSGEKPHQCTICGKSYLYKNNLSAHNKLHHPELVKDLKYHICEFCGKSFIYKKYLLLHEKCHTGQNKFLCDLCGKVVSTRESLKFHRRTHTGEKPLTCEVCGKTFNKPQYLQIHLRTHTGEKPHNCTECGKSFTQRSSLVVHMRYHSGDRPYKCTICTKGFVSKTLLNNHLKTHGLLSFENENS